MWNGYATQREDSTSSMRQRVAHQRARVELRPLARRDGDLRELLARRAVLVHVARRRHRVRARRRRRRRTASRTAPTGSDVSNMKPPPRGPRRLRAESPVSPCVISATLQSPCGDRGRRVLDVDARTTSRRSSCCRCSFGTMPRYSQSCTLAMPPMPHVNTASTSDLSMPASRSAFRAAWACIMIGVMFGTMPISSVSSAPTMATLFLMLMPRPARRRPEQRQRDLVGHVLPLHLDRHVAADVLGHRLHADEVRHHARAFVELDDRGDVRRREPGHLRPELDRERVQLAAAAAGAPLDVPREAARAELPRVEEELLARRAVRQRQLVPLAGVPERLRLRAGPGQRLRVLGHRHLAAFTSSRRRDRTRAGALGRAVMAPARSCRTARGGAAARRPPSRL